MTGNIKSIPTFYAGTWFRSRLEARWAAFFDLSEWRWTYEPDDMEGYVPDFKLWFRVPILVEVKPLQWDESESDEEILDGVRSKFVRAGIKGEAIALGSRIVTASSSGGDLVHHTLGAIMEVDSETDEVTPWEPAFAFRCEFCSIRSFGAEDRSWHCRVRGCYDGRKHIGPWDANLDYRRAGSQTQWKAPA